MCGLKYIKTMVIVLMIIVGVFFGYQAFAENNNKNNKSKEDISNFLTEHTDLQFVFLLPVIDEQVKLKITIPKSFKALEGDPNAPLLEFIPKTDQDPYKWSEIITLNKILGSGVTAPDYMQKMEALYLKSTDPNAKIVESNKHIYENFQDASSIIQYRSNGRDEVVMLYSVSGPMDIANVQYALPLSSPQALNDTVQKLKDFMKSNVEIVRQ